VGRFPVWIYAGSADAERQGAEWQDPERRVRPRSQL